MLKKYILSILLLILTACSNVATKNEETSKMSSKKEVIKQVISTSEKDIILLGENYDYQFTDEEGRKLLTLIDFLKIKGLTRENLSHIEKTLTVEENGKVRLHISTNFKFYKKNKNNTDDINFITNFKQKLEEKNIEFQFKDDDESWNFYLPNTIDVYGKVIKLANHDEILKDTEKQLINLDINLRILQLHHQEETEVHSVAEMIGEKIIQGVGGFVAIITAPVWVPILAVYAAVYVVVLIPAFIIEDYKYKNMTITK